MSLFDQNEKILIVGDAILDVYHFGKVERVSPEAPVPVVQVTKTLNKLGGSANVANNISKLNAKPFLLGYCGNDNNEKLIKSLLETNRIDYSLININHPTITKVRVLAGVQQIVRVDFEEKFVADIQSENEQLNNFKTHVSDAKVIVISDYGKGLVSDSLCKTVIQKANELNIITIVDPKGNDWLKYCNATVVTPNLKELGDVYGSKINNEDQEIEAAGKYILEKYQLKHLLVTRSEKGMTFFDYDLTYHIRTTATEVFDVSGAGDTVVATLATALASSYSWFDSVNLANKAAGVVVSKIGTVPITYKELESTIYEYKENRKIIDNNVLEEKVESIKLSGEKIVFTNGCFDIIHKGHIRYLQQAKSKGDILMIGLNSDASVKRLKGENRPIKDENERALILSALEFVDYVVIFSDDTPYNLIKIIQPDILVKGGDYKAENIIGREFAKQTITIPFVDGYSTTSTINKMNSNNN